MKLRENPKGPHVRIGIKEMPHLLSLDPWALHFYLVLLDKSQKNRSAIVLATYKELIGGFNITKRWVIEIMKQLKDAGLIDFERCGNGNKYFLKQFVESDETEEKR